MWNIRDSVYLRQQKNLNNVDSLILIYELTRKQSTEDTGRAVEVENGAVLCF